MLVEMKFGSHLYGLATENSDTDYKAIYLPSVEDLVFGAKESIVESTGGEGRNSKEDVDTEVVSIQKFIKDALSGQTYTIDMMHCGKPLTTSREWEFIVENRKMFYTKNMKAYMGYVKQQAAKYGIKGSRLSDIKNAINSLNTNVANHTLEAVSESLYTGEYVTFETIKNTKTGVEETYYVVNNKKYQLTNTVEYTVERLQKMYDSYGERAKMAEKNEGVDWKAVSHALRAGYQMKAIYEHGDFEYLLAESGYILAVKRGEIPFSMVSVVLEALVEDINELCKNTKLPDEPDREFWKNWVVGLYQNKDVKNND